MAIGGGSFSMCLGDGETATRGGYAFPSHDESKFTGRISGRFSLSAGMDVPSKPKWGRSSDCSSSSGLTQAFPFRNLSSFAIKKEEFKSGNLMTFL